MGNKLIVLCFALVLQISIAVHAASAEKLDKVRFTYAPLSASGFLSAYYENRYVEELEREGFFKKLWQ